MISRRCGAYRQAADDRFGHRRFEIHLVGMDIKREDAPRLTPSLRIALHDLRLDHLTVLYPGSRAYERDARVSVVPLGVLATGNPEAVLPRARRRQRARKPSR
jgi:hypothetical protein